MVMRFVMPELLERRGAPSNFTYPPVSAETSLSKPVMPRQSPRFGVTLISNNQSSRLVSGSFSGESDSTSRPAIVSNPASFSADTLNVTNSFSQLNVNFIGTKYWSDGVLVLKLETQYSVTPPL